MPLLKFVSHFCYTASRHSTISPSRNALSIISSATFSHGYTSTSWSRVYGAVPQASQRLFDSNYIVQLLFKQPWVRSALFITSKVSFVGHRITEIGTWSTLKDFLCVSLSNQSANKMKTANFVSDEIDFVWMRPMTMIFYLSRTRNYNVFIIKQGFERWESA